ncbi:MAG: coat protein [Properatisvirus sabatis]|uniref:Coat protein n=1 Tax=Circoviridae sp. TaxID=1954248 RepID=A0A345MYK0_9VIRU|nr:MAG: coat protein [Circoviridae sp.]
MPRKGSRNTKRFEKNVKAIVRDELREELENKVGVIGANDVDLDTSAIPNGDVAASSNFVRILPLISQGDGQYNERIGNEIRLKHLDIKMLINYGLANLSTNNNEDTSLGVRVMILRQKDENASTGAVENFQGNKLLENGLVSGAPAAFSGDTFNLLQKINREQFSVRYDKVHYIDAAYRYSGGGTTVTQSFFPPKSKVISKRLTFGKQGLKLTYGDGASSNPTNFPYFMVLGVASTVSTTVPSNNLLRYSYSANASYTDA